jgi:hypothetical protein
VHRTFHLPEACVLIACWSTKGGAGTTVVSASLGLLLAATSGAALAVDLAGDLPAALGLRVPPAAPGVAGWLAAAPEVPPDALARCELDAGRGLAVVARGNGPLAPAGADLLASVLAGDARPVVADCGRVDGDGADAAHALAAAANRSLLVLRACFLALQRAASAPLRPSGVVLLLEPGRAITAGDVEQSLGVPVLARVRVTDSVARAVDAGLLTAHLPRTLAHDLRHVA